VYVYIYRERERVREIDRYIDINKYIIQSNINVYICIYEYLSSCVYACAYREYHVHDCACIIVSASWFVCLALSLS